MKVWRITCSESESYLILNSVEDVVREVTHLMGEMIWSKSVGEDIKLSLEEMDKKDYENLPEFDAWR